MKKFSSMADFNSYGTATHEFIGIILPYESQKDQIDGNAGFGHRYRVAIMGNHPSDNSIKDEDIVFATTALGVSDGSGAAGRQKKPALSQGDVVLGKFLDGDNKQNPLITNVLGRTSSTFLGPGRFQSKTGFVGPVKKGNLLDGQESSENEGIQTPSARIEGNKSNRQEPTQDLEKAGIQSNKVGAVPQPKKSVLADTGDVNDQIILERKMKDFVDYYNNEIEPSSEIYEGVKMHMDGQVPDIGRYIVELGDAKITKGEALLKEAGAPPELQGYIDELKSDPNWKDNVAHDINKNLEGTSSYQAEQVASEINISTQEFRRTPFSAARGAHPVPTDFGMPMDHHS